MQLSISHAPFRAMHQNEAGRHGISANDCINILDKLFHFTQLRTKLNSHDIREWGAPRI